MRRIWQTTWVIFIASFSAKQAQVVSIDSIATPPADNRQLTGNSVECVTQHLLHHPAVHVGQAEVAAGVAVGQLLVVEAEQVQHRRVQVVDVDLVLDRREAELVGRAVRPCRPSRRRRPASR